MPPNQRPVLLTLAEASEYLHRPPSFLRRLVAQREIRHIKLRGRLLFDAVDLDALLAASVREAVR